MAINPQLIHAKVDELKFLLLQEVGDTYRISNERDNAIKFQYTLRMYIEGEKRKNTPDSDILNAVLQKLKEVTPHGANNQVDP